MTNTTNCPTTSELRDIYIETKKLTRSYDLIMEPQYQIKRNGEWEFLKIRITSANGPGVLFHLNGERISKGELQKIIG